MKIERCPFCGSSDENIGRTSESVIRFWVHCRTCYYDGPAKATVEQAIDAHNRLSRIVRAAERLVKARKALVDAFALMDMDFPHFSVSEKARDMDFEIEQANKALTDAVEGG